MLSIYLKKFVCFFFYHFVSTLVDVDMTSSIRKKRISKTKEKTPPKNKTNGIFKFEFYFIFA